MTDGFYPLARFDVAITSGLQHSVPEWLRPVFGVATVVGATPGWLLVIAFSFWWSGSRLGVRVALVSSLSAVANVVLKWIFLQPRPYFLSDRIAPLEAADGFGMPSGHTQGTAATWGALARFSRDRWLWWVAAVAILLTALARVYYGVHSVLQVVCGALLGLAIVAVVGWLEAPVGRWWGRAGPAARWIAAILPAALFLAIGLVLRYAIFADWEAPLEWVTRHAAASASLGPSTTAELRLIDSSVLLRWSGGLLGASLVAAWYATPGRAALVVASLRRRTVNTAIGLPAMAVVLGAGEALIRRAGTLAELPHFAVLLWVVGVVVPRLGERVDTALSRRA